MITEEYRLFINDIIRLTRSLIIKSEQNITAINTYLQSLGCTIPEDKSNQKYYLNIAGEYWTDLMTGMHDLPINIVSLDTGEQMVFNKFNLARSPLTRAEYLKMESAYIDLIKEYPFQEILIEGILNPIDLNTAINAQDYTILYYSTEYIGIGEINLISKLQQWIYLFAQRWDKPNFTITDKLYSSAFLGILFMQIPNVIVNIRLENCKTEMAHEWHIWNYLAGYFRLDQFKGKIPHAQALWLYRNIEYLKANAGRSDTLDFINDGFAKPFNLNLYSYVLKQDTANAINNLQNHNLFDLTKTAKFNRFPYAQPDLIESDDRLIATSVMVKKLIPLGLLNYKNVDSDTVTLDNSPLVTDTNYINTGIIECNVEDSVITNLVSVVNERLNNWFYLSSIDAIRYKHELNIPSLGLALTVTAKEAACILLYVAAKYAGITLTDIPVLNAHDIMYPPNLTELELRSGIESKYLNGSWSYGSVINHEWERYSDLLASMTYPVTIPNVDAFNVHIDNVILSKFRHFLFVNLEEDADGRGQLENLVNRFYIEHECVMVQETLYIDLFNRLGVDFSALDNAGCEQVNLNILKAFIGIDAETTTLPPPYSYMVEILKIVCSYTVQFISGNNPLLIEPIDWAYSLPVKLKEYLRYKQIVIPVDMDADISVVKTTDSGYTSLESDLICDLKTFDVCAVHSGVTVNLSGSHTSYDTINNIGVNVFSPE